MGWGGEGSVGVGGGDGGASIDSLIRRHESNLRSPVYGVICYLVCSCGLCGWDVLSCIVGRMGDKDGRTSRCLGVRGEGRGSTVCEVCVLLYLAQQADMTLRKQWALRPVAAVLSSSAIGPAHVVG